MTLAGSDGAVVLHRVVVGPLELDDYRRMLPGGDSFRRLRDWVRNYAGMAYEWDINVQLKRAAVPPLALGATAGQGARLGWTSWLHAGAPARDARQLVLHARHTNTNTDTNTSSSTSTVQP